MKYLILLLLPLSVQAQETLAARMIKNFARGYSQATQQQRYQQDPQIIPPQLNFDHINNQQPQNCITTRTMSGVYYTTCN